MDYIYIERLKVYAYHGVFPEENERGQNFYVSAKLFLNTRKAGQADDLDASVNYALICQDITEFMVNNTFKLIETVAEKLSFYLLNKYVLIREISLTIHKPEAPVGLPVSDISVNIHRGWNKSYIAIGSNMGDSKAILKQAVKELSEDSGIRLLKESSIIVTKPYGGVAQPDFYNGCIMIETLYDATELLEVLHKVENNAHRTREIHWGPRTLDLDIILYGEEIIHNDDLIIPHVDMQNRDFVLRPMCEIAPNAYHPVLKKTMKELLDVL